MFRQALREALKTGFRERLVWTWATLGGAIAAATLVGVLFAAFPWGPWLGFGVLVGGIVLGVALEQRLRQEGPAQAYGRGLELLAQGWRERGMQALQAGDYERAAACFAAALELRPNDPDTLNNKGVALDDLGRYEEALAAFERALALRPDNPDTLYNKGVALGHLGRYEEALLASPFKKYRGYLKDLAGRDPDELMEQMRGR